MTFVPFGRGLAKSFDSMNLVEHIDGIKLEVVRISTTVVPAMRGHCRFGAKVSPRGRWSPVAGTDILTHRSICGHTSALYRVCTANAYTNEAESNENRDIPSITTCTVCPLLGINRHNKSTIVCKCSDNLFQTNVYLYRSHTHSHACTHARAHTHDKKHGVRLRWVARRRTRSPGWRDEWLGDNSTDLRLPAGAAKFYSDSST